MKKVLSCALMISLIILCLSPYKAYASSPPDVVANGALLVDASSQKILYEKNKDTRFYPASTTKIMTALLVLEHCKLDDIVTVGKKPSSFIDGDKIYIFEGEKISVNELLHALLIASANDVAVALAEHVAGSEEAFVKLMNQKAKELGCTNTHFMNPHGLHDPQHYTTAKDLSLIAKEAMKYDAFREIITTVSYKMPPTNKQPLYRPLYTNNNLLTSRKYHVDGANGIKVGYTDEAGHSFVGSAYRGDTKFIVVLLNDKKPGMWEDASSLLNYGFDNFKTEKEISKGDFIQSLKVDGTDTKIPLTAASDLYYTHPISETPNLSLKTTINGDCEKGIKKDQVMGYAEYWDKDMKVGTVTLKSNGDLSTTAFYNYVGIEKNTVKKSLSPKIYVPAAIFIFLFLMAILRILVVRRRKKIRLKKINKTKYMI